MLIPAIHNIVRVRDTRDTLFLLGAIAWVVALQAPHLPVWCTALTMAVLVGRGVLAVQQKALPRWYWKLGLLLLALLATWLTYRTLLGRDAGVTLVVLLLALKTLELHAKRDAFVVFFLGFFTLLTHFFYSQSLLTAVGILLALWGLLTALINAHMPLGHPPLWQTAKRAASMAALGAPIMLALFVFFPRLPPLWGLPSDGLSGRSGLSAQMEVGNIASLALDGSIAFRVKFEGAIPPFQQLYFRGPVLAELQGRSWKPLPDVGQFRSAFSGWEPTGPAIDYEVTQEPSSTPWLFVLEATPKAPQLPGARPRLNSDLQWTLEAPRPDTLRYKASSHLSFRLGVAQTRLSLQPYLDLPSGQNPRTLQWAQDLRSAPGRQGSEPEQLIRLALDRLRTGGYRYTLAPGLYGLDTADEFWFDRRAGFCEHIASSFVVLMRALNIPARVVTGYQGGTLNPLDRYWTVRQSDAHAWAEVWLEGKGWQRIDPTAWVSPDRINTDERLEPNPGLFMRALANIDPSLWLRLRNGWDAVNNRWNQWVLNYTSQQQLNLLSHLGFETPSPQHLVQLLGAALATLSLTALTVLWWLQKSSDPWLRLLEQARQKLRAAGLNIPAHATPRQLAAALESLATTHPHLAPKMQQWLVDMEMWRYDHPSAHNPAKYPTSQNSLKDLRKRLRQLEALPRL